MSAYIITWIIGTTLFLSAQLADNRYGVTLRENGMVKHSISAKRKIVLAVVVLSFVAGCRYFVGSDFINYYYDYKEYAEVAWHRVLSLDEPVIFLIYWFVNLFVDNPQICIFVVAAITTIIGVKVIYKNSKALLLPMILYMFVVWHTSFNGVRQALAVSVLFTGYPYLKEKNFWKYLLHVFLAFLCHASAATMILLFFAIEERFKPKKVIIIVVLAIIALKSYEYIFNMTGWLLDTQMYYDPNVSNYWGKAVNRLRILFEAGPFIAFAIMYWKKDKTGNVAKNLYILLMHAVVAVVTMNSPYLARMSLYTMPYAIMAISELIDELELEKNKKILSIVMVALFMFFGIYEITHEAMMTPFKFYWEAVI